MDPLQKIWVEACNLLAAILTLKQIYHLVDDGKFHILYVRASGPDFVVLVLSEAVLSETVLVLDGCLNCGVTAR
jgi:hypothetical protein